MSYKEKAKLLAEFLGAIVEFVKYYNNRNGKRTD